jgi:antitoxin (DNA-binding transcriptional repressor) of toxin-antitoxin stability system
MYQVQVSLDEAKEKFLSLIEETINGNEVIIIKDNKTLIKLVLVPQIKIQPQAGSAKGLITMSDDFDEPLEDFREYME